MHKITLPVVVLLLMIAVPHPARADVGVQFWFNGPSWHFVPGHGFSLYFNSRPFRHLGPRRGHGYRGYAPDHRYGYYQDKPRHWRPHGKSHNPRRHFQPYGYRHEPKYYDNRRYGYRPKHYDNRRYGYRPKHYDDRRYGYRPKHYDNRRYGTQRKHGFNLSY